MLFFWVLTVPLGYVAIVTGWVVREVGRQPWVVYGVMLTRDATSPAVGLGLVLTTLVGFTLIYGVLTVVDVYLLTRFARSDPPVVETPAAGPTLVY